eukprot:TRINITY_DN1304_c0_g1_i1.p1 TRINITY_DN1304_c0_g1~~TRINITY_DN1304_c0_g1_i1.p1  ORF type:complete len:187 (+),score=55.86 TRINITY_DN1304_c0_g1_i1:953-1513(+)
MTLVSIPFFLQEFLGERQSVSDLAMVVGFTTLGTWYLRSDVPSLQAGGWKCNAALMVIGDILAGAIGNFTKGTNDRYFIGPEAEKYSARVHFYLVHFHLLIVAALMNISLKATAFVSAYTIGSSLLVNALRGSSLHPVIAGTSFFTGLVAFPALGLPKWFETLSVLFLGKLVVAFSLNHHPVNRMD